MNIEFGATADSSEYSTDGLGHNIELHKRAGAPNFGPSGTFYIAGDVATTYTFRVTVTSVSAGEAYILQDIDVFVVTVSAIASTNAGSAITTVAPTSPSSAAATSDAPSTTTINDFTQYAPVPTSTATATGSENTFSFTYNQQVVPGLTCKNCSMEGAVDFSDGGFSLTDFTNANFTAVANGIAAHVELEASINH